MLRNIGHEISTEISVWLSTQLLNKNERWFMQHKYSENSAHSKWFTHFKSKHIIFIFGEKAGRNIYLVQPTPISVVIWSKIKKTTLPQQKQQKDCLFEVKETRLTVLVDLKSYQQDFIIFFSSLRFLVNKRFPMENSQFQKRKFSNFCWRLSLFWTQNFTFTHWSKMVERILEIIK